MRHKREKQSKHTRSHSSITGVNPCRSHGVGIWGGRRKVVGIRLDEELYLAFKPFAQRVFGSVCLPLECIMAGLLAAHVKAQEHGVNPGKTVTFNVDDIVIHRHLRSRRNLEFVGGLLCGHADCSEVAVGSGVWRSGKELLLCEEHFAEAGANLRDWKNLRISQSASEGDDRG